MTLAAHEIHHEAKSCQAISCGYTGSHPAAPAFLQSLMEGFNNPYQSALNHEQAHETPTSNPIAAAAEFVKNLSQGKF